MKRLGIFTSLLFLLFSSPMLLPARPNVSASVIAVLDELPWSTVDAVLKRVDELYPYTYSQLVEWYQVSLCTVEQSGSSYLVTIYNEDGALTQIIIDQG